MTKMALQASILSGLIALAACGKDEGSKETTERKAGWTSQVFTDAVNLCAAQAMERQPTVPKEKFVASCDCVFDHMARRWTAAEVNANGDDILEQVTREGVATACAQKAGLGLTPSTLATESSERL